MSEEVQVTTEVSSIVQDETGNVISEEKVTTKEILQKEEEKLKARLPQLPNKAVGHSAFLQKRLAKGQKYFDSGDYNMARQRGPTAAAPKLQPVLQQPTGDTIPTPECVPARKTSILASKLATPTLSSNE